MTHLTGEQRSAFVSAMFARIARRYDVLNRLMTLGQDGSWRRSLLRELTPRSGERLLDLGAGTGDLAFEALRQCPQARVVAADFTPAMMAVGRRRAMGSQISWVVADALHLPFRRGAFDALASGFLLRNVADVDAALREQSRVLQPQGRLGCLDTTPPQPGVLQPFLRFHLRVVIPLLGRLVAGDAEAYNYLPESTEQFQTAESLAGRMEDAGFRSVRFERRMLGTIALHWAVSQS
jgi:demethylmenaquinone methyltransferase/2-methoxy-6-polyprenyl-1,4-benzoquinol methylase